MRTKQRVLKAAAGIAAATMFGGVLALQTTPTASAGATCGQVVYDPDLDVGLHTCEVTGAPADITYTFDCGAFVGERVWYERWSVSQTALIPNQCDGSPWGIEFSYR